MEMYKKEGINITTRYTVEYIDNQKDLDYINNGIYKHGEPWERYKTKQFDNMDQALSLYMVYSVNDAILDIKLFEEILLDNETIREAYIEPENTTSYYMKNFINKNLYKQNTENLKQLDNLETENNLYKQFIKQFHAEKSFNEFIKSNIA